MIKKIEAEFMVLLSLFAMVMAIIFAVLFFMNWNIAVVNKLSFFLLTGYFCAVFGYLLAKVLKQK